MAKIPQKLGNQVTTRTFSFRDMVLREWGSDFNKPDTAYEFSGGLKCDSTDSMPNGSFYRKPGT